MSTEAITITVCDNCNKEIDKFTVRSTGNITPYFAQFLTLRIPAFLGTYDDLHFCHKQCLHEWLESKK